MHIDFYLNEENSHELIAENVKFVLPRERPDCAARLSGPVLTQECTVFFLFVASGHVIRD
jgi:hypothetical protein